MYREKILSNFTDSKDQKGKLYNEKLNLVLIFGEFPQSLPLDSGPHMQTNIAFMFQELLQLKTN